ncbi:hypothetical protein CHU98_g9862 [Xylaria longipes]|nr:hypothetical protein CHU98_g9862 [Xylaria longipes]
MHQDHNKDDLDSNGDGTSSDWFSGSPNPMPLRTKVSIPVYPSRIAFEPRPTFVSRLLATADAAISRSEQEGLGCHSAPTGPHPPSTPILINMTNTPTEDGDDIGSPAKRCIPSRKRPHSDTIAHDTYEDKGDRDQSAETSARRMSGRSPKRRTLVDGPSVGSSYTGYTSTNWVKIGDVRVLWAGSRQAGAARKSLASCQDSDIAFFKMLTPPPSTMPCLIGSPRGLGWDAGIHLRVPEQDP